MRITILDKDFQTLGTVGVFNSLIWCRRYYEAGMFECHAPVEYFELLNTGRYFYRSDRDELGVIREVNYSQTDKGERRAYCKGYFAESLLDNRVINSPANLTGTPETIARSLVNTYIINPGDTGRKIPQIVLGAAKGIGSSITIQTTGDKLGEKLYDILETQEESLKLSFDYQNNILTFTVWSGLDRTDEQDINSWATFSNSFYNVKNVVYDRDDSEAKNYAYVAGEGEGAARTVVQVDVRSSSAIERREVYVDARDLQSTYRDEQDVEHTYTAAQYRELLRQRGLEKLAEYATVETVNSDIDANANLEYMTDFDLGDLCTYQNNDVGIECVKRITEIQEVYEGAKASLNITFGNDESTTITKIIRRETT